MVLADDYMNLSAKIIFKLFIELKSCEENFESQITQQMGLDQYHRKLFLLDLGSQEGTAAAIYSVEYKSGDISNISNLTNVCSA